MIETPSVCNPLSQTPATSSHRIIELGEKSLLEWSMTRHIVSESGLGMAWTSGLYILSKSFIPNNSEKCSAAISVQTCSSRKSHSCSLFGRHHDPSHNFRYPSFIMSANGQNPSCNLNKTESMKAQFGWWVSSPSNVLMSILQMILNRSGQFDIITCLTGSLSDIGLGCGKGFAVSEYPAVGPNSSSLTHWLSIDISWHASVSCPSHDITQAFLLVHSFSAYPSFLHLMQTCLYQYSEACFPHFPWLNNWHRSLLHHVDTPPHCPVDDPHWFLCAPWSPAALLKMCHTSRNLNFLNWSSNMLLTDPVQRQIALLRLRTWFCPPALVDTK